MRRIFPIAAALLASAVMLQAQQNQPIIRVTLLGTGVPLLDPTAYLNSGRVNAGLLVEAGGERMLFDCGQGIMNRLLQSGGPADDPNVGVDKVFLSHLHTDHIADLPSLYAYGWLFRYNLPLRVWGPGPGPNQPTATTNMMNLLRLAFDTDFYVRSSTFKILTFPLEGVQPFTTELWEDVVYANKGVTVEAFKVNHQPMDPSFGFRVSYQGKSVVFSGDTKFSQNLIDHSKGADVLMHEIWGFAEADAPELFTYHTPPADAARVFNQTAPKMAVFTHIATPPGTTAQDLVTKTRAAGYAGPLTIGLDLMKIDVTATGVVVTPPPAAAPRAEEASPNSAPAELRALRPTI